MTGPVASVVIVRPVHHAPVADDGEPGPLEIPIIATEPVHILSVDEAWAVGPHDVYRWRFAGGRQVTIGASLSYTFHPISHKRFVAGVSP